MKFLSLSSSPRLTLCGLVATISLSVQLSFQQTSYANYVPLAGLLIALALNLTALIEFAFADNFRRVNRYCYHLLLPALTVPIAVYELAVPTVPGWMSEAFAVRDIHLIQLGQLLNPVGTSGDFPSRFMQFVVYPVAAVSNSPLGAMRFVGLLTWVATIPIIALLTEHFLRRKIPALSTLPICIFITMIHQSRMGDNSWIVMLPFWTALMSALLLKLIDHPEDKAVAVLLGTVCGLAMWTLYLPAAIALVFIIATALELLRRKQRQTAWEVLLLFTLVASPVLSEACLNPWLLTRHLSFLTGGERHRPDDLCMRISEASEIVRQVVLWFTPVTSNYGANIRSIVLDGWQCFLFWLGFVLLIRQIKSSHFKSLCFIQSALVLIVLLSSPRDSPYRFFVLIPFCSVCICAAMAFFLQTKITEVIIQFFVVVATVVSSHGITELYTQKWADPSRALTREVEMKKTYMKLVDSKLPICWDKSDASPLLAVYAPLRESPACVAHYDGAAWYIVPKNHAGWNRFSCDASANWHPRHVHLLESITVLDLIAQKFECVPS